MPSEANDGSLRALALGAMESAYAPYSAFQVGAALETTDGRRFIGCNIENASFPVTICAERVALGAAIVHGATQFRRIAVASTGPEPASPCGMCRQALAEFGLDLEVICLTPEGVEKRWTLGELLPDNFRLRPRPEADGRG
jgi:cytidine deaminase